MDATREVFQSSLLVTAFVAAMMILVEYLNVLTLGRTRGWVTASKWGQYLVAVVLGATPGCLGAFVVVALYIHRGIGLGALVAAMVVTSGDESFVMLALFPRTAILLTLGLAVVGILAGLATDLSLRRHSYESCDAMVFHPLEEDCRCLDPSMLTRQWRPPSSGRGYLSAGCALFAIAIILGMVGPPTWGWMRVTLLAVSVLALFVVTTVPDHFIRHHLWEHVIRGHVPRIFGWTLGALAAMALLDHWVDAEHLIRDRPRLMLGAAGLLGLIPESGPHMFFVTLFEKGLTPLSVLITSSIVQDGHGSLPLLAHSRKDFLRVKTINLATGLIVGALVLWMGR